MQSLCQGGPHLRGSGDQGVGGEECAPDREREEAEGLPRGVQPHQPVRARRKHNRQQQLEGEEHQDAARGTPGQRGEAQQVGAQDSVREGHRTQLPAAEQLEEGRHTRTVRRVYPGKHREERRVRTQDRVREHKCCGSGGGGTPRRYPGHTRVPPRAHQGEVQGTPGCCPGHTRPLQSREVGRKTRGCLFLRSPRPGYAIRTLTWPLGRRTVGTPPALFPLRRLVVPAQQGHSRGQEGGVHHRVRKTTPEGEKQLKVGKGAKEKKKKRKEGGILPRLQNSGAWEP